MNNKEYTKKLPAKTKLKDPMSESVVNAASICSSVGIVLSLIIGIIGLVLFFQIFSYSESIGISFLVAVPIIAIAVIIYFLFYLMSISLDAKASIMNNTYKNAMLIEWWLTQQHSSVHNPDSVPSVNKSIITCPKCHKPLSADSNACGYCGYKFPHSPDNANIIDKTP